MVRFPNTYTNIAALLFFAAFFIGCVPKPEVVGATSRTGAPGFDYTIYVDCTVRNRGSGGQVTVLAELNADGFWKKEQTVFIAEDATQKVTFTFPEPAFGFSHNYKCGVEKGIRFLP